jgi:isopentenyl diphosphate isomerase/L-lactate dehydrogenase-like FMN-dependent dehydrogenase
MTIPINLRDFEPLAREHMDAAAFDYVAGGALDERTLRENESAFARRRLRPRVMVDVSSIDTTTSLLGAPVAMPVGIAPTAQHAFAHADAECATARAAAAAGVLFCASTMSSRSMEEIAAAGGRGPRWFQLYLQTDRSLTEGLVARAVASGYTALALTVDTPVTSRRERDLRNALQLPVQLYGNFLGLEAKGVDVASFVGTLINPRLAWDDIAWLRSISGLPVVLKGIVTAEDARLAVEHGAAAVWVSNHGGRQLDRTVATLDALEEVVAAVDGRIEVYVDGGVRRGIDVVTALALGARAVFIGRPVMYALAADGDAGVALMVQLLSDELRNAMALLGAPTLADITRAHVV